MITYLPSTMLSRITKKRLAALVTNDLKVNQVAVKSLAALGIMTQKSLNEVLAKVLKDYKSKYRREMSLGLSKTAAQRQALASRALLIQRVQDLIVYELREKIVSKYRGATYIWLPSNADEPDPEHQLKYGKRFRIGQGEMPGQRHGCRCGMRIEVDDKRLDI